MVTRTVGLSFASIGLLGLCFAYMHDSVAATTSAAPPVAAEITALASVASILEADVAAVTYSYNEQSGPRTIVSLSNVTVHRGKAPDSATFSQIGGPMPDGSFVRASELPFYNAGSHYIFFMMAGDWSVTPVWNNMAFRAEVINGRSFVLDREGAPVVHFDLDGIFRGPTTLIDYGTNRDPLAGHPITNTHLTPDEEAHGLDVTGFLSAADRAIDSIGGLSPGQLTFVPRFKTPWNSFSTTPHLAAAP